MKKWAQKCNWISPDLVRYKIRTETTGSALAVVLHVLISKQNEYKILADYIFSQCTWIGGISLILTCITVLHDLVKWIVLLRPHSQNLRGFKIRHVAKEMHFSPCAVCSLSISYKFNCGATPEQEKSVVNSIFLKWNQKMRFQGSTVGLKETSAKWPVTALSIPPSLLLYIALCPDAAAWNKQDSSAENIPLQWFLNVIQLILFYCCCYFLTPVSMLADVQNTDEVPLCIPSNLYIV